MPYSLEEAMSAYGFVYQLANNVPELKTFLDQAVANSWTPERLTASIESSPWWMQHADTVRNLAVLQATEPATYNQHMQNARHLIALKALSLGRSYTDAQLNQMAYSTLTENSSWDDQVLTNLVGSVLQGQLTHGEGGSLSADAARLADHMTQVAQSYGGDYSQEWLEANITAIQTGNNTLDGFESLMRARAKAAYPQFAAQIDAGLTLRDIADPYISTYAKTLEIPETEVTLRDTYIRKALSQTGQDGSTRTSMPLWQFERTLKDDPRYDSTRQAKDDAFAALNKIGKDWGFVGSSS